MRLHQQEWDRTRLRLPRGSASKFVSAAIDTGVPLLYRQRRLVPSYGGTAASVSNVFVPRLGSFPPAAANRGPRANPS